MKKRIISFVLIISVIVSTLCSCKKIFDNPLSEFEVLEEIQIKTDDLFDSIDETLGNAGTHPTLPEKPETKTGETINTDEDIREPVFSDFINDIGFSDNKAVPQSDYYQYNTLSGSEKELYERIAEKIAKSKYIVDVNDLSLTEEQVLSVFQKVLADYPQYFYVSKSCMVAYGTRKSKIRAVILRYTDGDNTDEFDKNLSLVRVADRDIINQKIAALQSEVKTVVSKINGNLPSVLKEKIIHDYIVKSVNYDTQTADNVKNLYVTLPHAFDLYGAAVENKAVCEGYAKLFQYLCYNVGINSTQIIGTGNNGNHMWNAVCIDNKWYQVDVTWDDADDYISYNYFNLTSESMRNDHTPDSLDISVPECNSTASSFDSVFAVRIKDLKTDPENYENAVLNTAKLGDKELYVCFDEDISNASSDIKYMKRYMFKESSAFNKYLKKHGITLENSLIQIGRYYVLNIEY